MAPKDDKKMKKKKTAAGGGKRGSSGRDRSRESKRHKRAAKEAASPAPPPIAREQPHERQQRLDRTLFVLTLVLERQRQANREYRRRVRHGFLRLVETAGDPRNTEWADEGYDDDDGENGAVAGDGWLTKTRRAPGEKRGVLPKASTFVRTLVSASHVCRSWRAAAFRAADRASIAPAALPGLRAYDGGVLRGLRVKGVPPGEAGSRDARAFSREVSGAARDPSLLRVASGLRLLDVDHAGEIMAALPALPRIGRAAAASSPPLFSNLVTLRVERWLSRWDPARPPPLLSAANFPSLRVLDVMVHPDSDCPLYLGGGGGDGRGGGAFSPPFLTRLRVGSKIKTPPSGQTWPPYEPLLVSLESLRALGPTLRSLSAGQPYGTGKVVEGAHDEDAPGAVDIFSSSIINRRNTEPPARLAPMSRLRPALTALSLLTSLELESETDFYPADVWGLKITDPDGFDDLPASTKAAAAKRARQSEWQNASDSVFRSMRATLRRLTVVARVDFGEPVALPNAISMLAALTCLRVRCTRLDSVGPLSKLVGLRVLYLQVMRSYDDYFYDMRAPTLNASDLRPLTAVEDLVLLNAPSSVAPVIARGLPALKRMMLCGDETKWNFSDDMDDEEGGGLPRAEPPLPLRVLRAARQRMESTGLELWLSAAKPGEGPKQLTAAALDRLIEESGGGDGDEEEEEEEEAEGGGDDGGDEE
jgi:hypothetical protein